MKQEQLLNKHCTVVANLTPAELSGVNSEGMVLSIAKKKKLEVLDAADIAPGTPILSAQDAESTKSEISIHEFKEVNLRIKMVLQSVTAKLCMLLVRNSKPLIF